MNRTGIVTMSMQELDRIKVIQAVVDANLKPGRAAERLGLTVRQINRLAHRYLEDGPAGLASRKRNKPSNNQLGADKANRALIIIRDRYADFGPTLACEKLREVHNIVLREPRKVSHVLTLQYDKAIYLLGDTPMNRRLIGKYIEVYDYPDGRIEIRANDYVLPYVRYDRLPDVDQGAIVENKRLGHVLQIAQLVQQQRDNRRSHAAPARTNLGLPVEKATAAPGTKVQRKIDVHDLERAIGKVVHGRN